MKSVKPRLPAARIRRPASASGAAAHGKAFCAGPGGRARRAGRRQGGFTAIEMMAATVVLMLLALMLHTGLSMALKSYYTAVERAETELLLSTLTGAISDELRFAREAQVAGPGDDTLSWYTSERYGRRTVLSVDSTTGQVMAGTKRLIATGAYGSGGYTVTRLDITYQKAQALFTVTLAVKSPSGLTGQTAFNVYALNANAV